jgi:hypothetical protein
MRLGRKGILAVDSDLDHKVTRKIFREVQLADRSFFDRIRDWLGW